MLDRVFANCTVDPLGKMQFAVNVEGVAPYDHRRVYTVKATSEDDAAWQGLRLFEDEMLCLHDADPKDD